MSEIIKWLNDGGAVMYALCVLSLAMTFLILEQLWDVTVRAKILRSAGAFGNIAMRETGELAGLRRMGLIRACIVIAPLFGLLGTVTGMIETFRSILQGGYITEMSAGIRKSLLTTQFGLAIAAPGLLVERFLLRRRQLVSQLAQTARMKEKVR